jgi:hypothetical protein
MRCLNFQRSLITSGRITSAHIKSEGKGPTCAGDTAAALSRLAFTASSCGADDAGACAAAAGVCVTAPLQQVLRCSGEAMAVGNRGGSSVGTPAREAELEPPADAWAPPPELVPGIGGAEDAERPEDAAARVGTGTMSGVVMHRGGSIVTLGWAGAFRRRGRSVPRCFPGRALRQPFAALYD